MSQATLLFPDGTVALRTTLMYGEEREDSTFPLPVEGLTAQQVGSLLTYHRRYQLCALLGVHPVGDDDDGNLAATAQQPTERFEHEEARQAAVERIKALSAQEQAAVKDWLRNNRVPALTKLGATVAQLNALDEFIAQLGTEPFGPVEGEGGNGERAHAVAAPSHPEPDAIPFDPVVALPNDSGSARKVRDSIRRGPPLQDPE